MIQKKISIYFLFFLSILLVNFDLNASITEDSEDDNNQTEESKDKSADEDTKPENLEECMMQAESMSDSKKCEKEFMKTIEEFIEEEELKKIDDLSKPFYESKTKRLINFIYSRLKSKIKFLVINKLESYLSKGKI